MFLQEYRGTRRRWHLQPGSVSRAWPPWRLPFHQAPLASTHTSTSLFMVSDIHTHDIQSSGQTVGRYSSSWLPCHDIPIEYWYISPDKLQTMLWVKSYLSAPIWKLSIFIWWFWVAVTLFLPYFSWQVASDSVAWSDGWRVAFLRPPGGGEEVDTLAEAAGRDHEEHSGHGAAGLRPDTHRGW